MAFQLGGGDELAEVSDINVTPFIDVILVLLIIFMVAAPLATVDTPVDLPGSNAPAQPRPTKPLFLTVKPDLALVLGDTPVAREALGAALDAATGADKTERVLLRADKAVPYGDLMDVMNALRSAGYLKVALVGMDAATAGTPAGTPTGTPIGAPAGAPAVAPAATPAGTPAGTR